MPVYITPKEYRTALRRRYIYLRDSLQGSRHNYEIIHADDKRHTERSMLLRLMKLVGGDIKQDEEEPEEGEE